MCHRSLSNFLPFSCHNKIWEAVWWRGVLSAKTESNSGRTHAAERTRKIFCSAVYGGNIILIAVPWLVSFARYMDDSAFSEWFFFLIWPITLIIGVIVLFVALTREMGKRFRVMEVIAFIPSFYAFIMMIFILAGSLVSPVHFFRVFIVLVYSASLVANLIYLLGDWSLQDVNGRGLESGKQ